MKKILLVEDDKSLSNGICLALAASDIEIEQVFDLNLAWSMYSSNEYALIILDINLPDGNGLEFLKSIRKNSNCPVIILTANDMETDIVTGLEMGADDYITKPFSLAVLRARVNTQIRHASIVMPAIQIDKFIFDFDKMEFTKDRNNVELSKTEQKLLKILIINKGQTLQRGELIDRIWTDGSEYVDENALSVTVKRLRDKLEDNPAKPEYIKTVYGIGYTWAVK
ncbi:MAG: response regulator transcription factor [Candidatus Metalachnospira sp.]|nr:response regulator transcription factor [Candidatus Metalachnospira sp.]